jgi:carbon monoxide dehydrogenase subunit G
MILQGEFRVAASRETVWKYLSDLPGLAPLLPGCDVIEPAGDGPYRVAAQAKVGPIKFRLDGKLAVVESLAGESLKLRVEGQDRLTGSHLRVLMGFRLVPMSEGETEVRHSADVVVSGRLGTIGQGIMHETVATMLEEFVRRLNARITGAPVEQTGVGVLSAKAAARSLKTGITSLLNRTEDRP